MMAPKLAELLGYDFLFYSNEPSLNEPPHVHIQGPEEKMKVWLETLEVAECNKIPAHMQTKLLKIVKDNQKKFLEVWKNLQKRS